MANNQLSSIQNIVHVMLENRSFDHMLGFLYPGKTGPNGVPFEGLMGTESNPDSNGNPITVYEIDITQTNAYYTPGADPGEGYANTNEQLFGTGNEPTPPVATNTGFVTNFTSAITLDQQEGYYVLSGTMPSEIMGMFPPSALPVLSGLAKGFAVCDHWFCSVPTNTLPNRAFAHAGTSQGHMSDATTSFTVPSIFGVMSANNLTWKIYGYDEEPLTRGDFPDLLSAPDANFGQFTDFQSDAAAGTLAQYSFLEPSWGSSGNSEHPNYDVALGEQFLLQVYEAVRTGPAWNQTLLIITYDEHGGCYDHVAPPTNAVPPDDSVGEYGFNFERFGLRVPAVLVSPLIAEGTIFNVPAGTMSIDHTSVLKTIETRWGLPPLTARDAAAPDLGDVLTLTVPRTDDPMAGVVAPAASGATAALGQVSHLEQVHAQTANDLPMPAGCLLDQPLLAHQTSPGDIKNFIASRFSAWQTARDAGYAPPGGGSQTAR
jgi:phospholipase C